MAGTDDPYDWLPGQPPPWLSAFNPPSSLVPPVETPARLTPEEEAQIEIDQPPAQTAPAPADTPPSVEQPAAPPTSQAQSAPATSFSPPWLAAFPQPQSQSQPQPAPTGEPLSVDVVSGAPPSEQPQGESPQDTLARITLDPNAPVEQRQQAFAGLAPDERTRIVNTADPTQLATIATSAMDPAELATIAVRHQQAQLHTQTAAQLEAARKTEEEARRNWETWQRVQQDAAARTAQLTAEANAISQEKIDPNEHGIGHFIASVLTSAVGGAMSQHTSGRNLALEEFDKRTAARIDAQKADIENRWKGATFKRNLIAEHLQQSGDLYRSQETYRIAQYDRALFELQTKAQDYDPQGTTALKIVQAQQQIAAQRAAALQTFNKQQIEDGLKQAQTLQALAGAAKTQQETRGLQLKQAGIGAKPKKLEDIPLTREQLQTMFPGAEIPIGMPPMTMKQAKAFAETGRSFKELTKSGAEVAKAQREASPEERARQFAVGELVDAQGKPLEFSAQSKQEIESLKASADLSVQLLDRIQNAYAKYGWSSDLLKSPEWQQAQTDYNQLIVEKKNVDELGALSGPDMELVTKALGGANPTGFRDPTPGLERARTNVIEKLNSRVRAASPTQKPKRWSPEKPPPPPPKTPEEGALEKMLKDPMRGWTINELAADVGAPSVASGDLPQRIGAARDANGGVLPAQRRYLNELIKTAVQGSGADSETARAHLRQIAEEAQDDNLRAAAANALQTVQWVPTKSRAK